MLGSKAPGVCRRNHTTASRHFRDKCLWSRVGSVAARKAWSHTKCDPERVTRPEPQRRRHQFTAAVLSVVFVGFTVWWLIDGGAGLDSLTVSLDGWLVRGPVDAVVGNLWMLGEPQVALIVVAAIAAYLVARRMYRRASLVVGALLFLSAAQLSVFVVCAEIHQVRLGIDPLSHLYPSGHTARVPMLGTVVALIAGGRARGWILAATAVLAVAVALDRTSSGVQTGSVVAGGLLLGGAAAAWFATLYSAAPIGRTRGTVR